MNAADIKPGDVVLIRAVVEAKVDADGDFRVTILTGMEVEKTLWVPASQIKGVSL